jgi:hypothetical protein
MAFGTVPIVSPEVDMTHYHSPPEEGVHYFRVQTPIQAKILSETTSTEKWEEMSLACKKWWRENASANGLWNLTKKLAI